MHRKHHLLAVVLCSVGLVTLATSLHTTTRAQNPVLDCIGQPYGTPGCPTRTSSSSSQSVPPHCGDSFLQESEGEQCDLGRFNGLSMCSLTCTALFCGDGAVTPYLGEECEPPVQEVYVLDPTTNLLTTKIQYAEGTCGRVCGAPACDSDGYCEGGCQWKFLPACPSSRSSSLLSSEASSEQSTAASDTSSSASAESIPAPASSSEEFHAAASSSSSVSSLPEQPQVRCGDGEVSNGEECDDGNQVQEDGCTNECTRPRCGDNIVQQNEQCDDGNLNNWDPCPNNCRLPVCGNSIREGSEECDDGNRTDTDTCSNSCVLPLCGDGVVQRGEECDDGNLANDDSCTNGCQRARCGDAIIQENEECDDGNRLNDDLCNNS